MTRAARGAPCEPIFDSCETGTTCHPTMGTCVAMRIESRLGQPCGARGDEFVTCDLLAGLECFSTGCDHPAPRIDHPQPVRAVQRGDREAGARPDIHQPFPGQALDRFAATRTLGHKR